MFGGSGFTDEESTRNLIIVVWRCLLFTIGIGGMFCSPITAYVGLFCVAVILVSGSVILVRFLLKKDGAD